MSELRSALPGAPFDGMARVEEAGLRGMITVKGDLGAEAFQSALTRLAGTTFPGPGEAKVEGEKGLCWMAPDEALVLVPYGEAPNVAAEIAAALHGTHHLVADVSDARAVFTLSGQGAREALAKLTPADLHPAAFAPGQFRRTRLAQVAAAFWMRDQSSFEIVCFRSQAAYVFDILKAAARTGSEVGYF